MCGESFFGSKECNVLGNASKSVGGVVGVLCFFDKIIYRKGAGEFCRAACGQGVVGTCKIVTEGFGAVSTHKNGARVADAIEIIKGVVNAELKVLGSELIGNVNGEGKCGGNNDFSVIIDRRTCDFGAFEHRNLYFKLLLNRNCELLGVGYKHSTCHFVVLGLGEKICRRVTGIGLAIGNNKDLIRIPNGDKAPVLVQWNGSEWGRYVLEGRKSVWTNDVTVPAGTGFWYMRYGGELCGGEFEIELPASKPVTE